MPSRVLILGGGFGGLTAATELVRLASDRASVTVVDHEPRFAMGLAKLWVATGTRRAEECMHARDRLARRGVGFLCEEVRAIDLAARQVHTGSRALPYDCLVIALGLEVVPETVPGLLEHGLNLYRMSGAEQVCQALSSFTGGDILLTVCATPFKCPPAPYEAAMLIDDFLRAHKVRDKANLEIATVEPRPLPSLPAENGNAVLSMLQPKGIVFSPGHKLVRVEAGKAVFENGVEKRFDLLIAIPPHRSPSVLRETAGLTDASGLIPVDRTTLVTSHPGVFAVGDCAKALSLTNQPIPRAGILAENQAKVVAANIAAELSGRSDRSAFDGRGFCFVEVGGGMAVKGEGEFYAPGGPIGNFAKQPSREAQREKVEFERTRLRAWFGD